MAGSALRAKCSLANFYAPPRRLSKRRLVLTNSHPPDDIDYLSLRTSHALGGKKVAPSRRATGRVPPVAEILAMLCLDKLPPFSDAFVSTDAHLSHDNANMSFTHLARFQRMWVQVAPSARATGPRPRR